MDEELKQDEPCCEETESNETAEILTDTEEVTSKPEVEN
jgi:hypothetical protein